MVDISVGYNRLSVLKRNGGNVAEFCKETHYHLFASTSFSVSFKFHRRGSHLGRPTLPTVASSRNRVGIPRFRLLLRCLNVSLRQGSREECK